MQGYPQVSNEQGEGQDDEQKSENREKRLRSFLVGNERTADQNQQQDRSDEDQGQKDLLAEHSP